MTARCVLHIDLKLAETLKQFDSTTWQKVLDSDKNRRQNRPKSKYNSIQLPETYDDSTCYHSNCHKKFTALPKSLVVTEGSVDENHHVLRSNMLNKLCAVLSK